MENKGVALVTGSSRGIGKAIATELAKANYDVIVNYQGNVEKANETVEELKKLGSNSIALQFDVTKKEIVEEKINEIYEKYGRIDVLVNNAGITRDNLFIRMKEEDWLNVINTNLNSIYYVTNPVSKIMIKQRSGSIVNISSIVGIYGNGGQANYAAAKAGIIGVTKALSKELASRNIRVNAVAPGFIKTDMTNNLPVDKIIEHIPLKRLGEAEDVAVAVKFLAVDTTYITGQILEVGGGLVI